MNENLARFQTLISHFERALLDTLPGLSAQILMAPALRKTDSLKPVPGARESGVLILLYPGSDDIKTVLILRSEYEGVHGGQVGFPGGKVEAGDRNIIHTALREANEELGIPQEAVNTLGQLSQLYIPPSNLVVTPVVGFMEQAPVFIPDTREVAAVIEVNLMHFIEEKHRLRTQVKTSTGLMNDVPYFAVGNYRIWGATAMMLSELSEILRKFSA